MATIFNALHSGLSAPILATYCGDESWSVCFDVDGKRQSEEDIDYVSQSGCVWHPDIPNLDTANERRTEVISGTLLVPTELDLALSVKDRWRDASDTIWKPKTISEDIDGFRHVKLTRESRQFSGQTAMPSKR